MSLIKAVDVAHVRFSLPDLDVAERFLNDFGLVTAARDDHALYTRGLSRTPYLHAVVKGPAQFLGFAFEATSMTDLDTLAAADGVAIRTLDGPGGGKVVTLRDPDGFGVEVVAGRELVPEVSTEARAGVNRGAERSRINEVKRVAPGPSQVLRLGHVVLMVTDFRRSERWYKERFGLITSDEIEPEPGHAIGAFMRSDRGTTPSDHHTLFLLGTGTAAYEHAAFEVPDFDDLMRGNTHLTLANYKHSWGVGRHVLGSQIFDYWQDPWGNVIEHWTDGDVMDSAWGSRKAPLEQLLSVQWGQGFQEAHPPTVG